MSGSARSASRRTQTSRSAADDETSLELPPYQKPKCPLTAKGREDLRQLSGSRMNEKVLRHTEESAKLLADTVWAINDRVTIRKKEATKRRANHTNEDGDGGNNNVTTADVESARIKATELEEQVAPLTMRVEQAIREVLDIQAALLDDTEVLEGLPEAVEEAQLARAAQAEEQAGGPVDALEVPGVPVPAVLKQQLRAKTEAYDALSMYQRYARNNHYIDFKRNWHEGLYGDEIPVPDARTWFDSGGRPQHVVGGAGGDEDDSDAEVQIAREKRSFRCPLSLVTLTEPYTCRRCKHTFQKEAILSYLEITGRSSRGVQKQCPETGCQVQVSLYIRRVRGIRPIGSYEIVIMLIHSL